MLGPLTPLDDFLNSALERDLPDASLEVMRLCMFDWAICGLGTLRGEILTAMIQHAVQAGSGQASVFYMRDVAQHGGAARLPARAAALINGTISHALDVDDTHFAHIGHVSTVVIPAALAVAETQDHDFDAFVKAARLGAEVALRVGLWLGRRHYQAGWHQTATAGAYGAAAAAALLMKAPMRYTLSNVAGFATGQKAQFGSAMKPMNAGMAAAHGVEAAQLAKVGLHGSPDIFEAVLRTQDGEGNSAAFDGLGQDWLFDSVSHKYHACCHGTHAMIEAIKSLNLPREAQITKIDLRTHPRWMSVCNKSDPVSWLEGKFSYAFLAALVLAGEDTLGPAPDLYFPLSDHTRRQMSRVSVVADDRLSETACDVTVHIASQEARKAFVDIAQPEPLEDRKRKLRAKADMLLMPVHAAAVWDAVEARDLAAFTGAIRHT